MPRRAPLLTVLTVALAITAGHGAGAQEATADAQRRTPPLAPTAHVPLPTSPSQYWYVPDASEPGGSAPSPAEERFARALRMIGDGEYAAAVPLLNGTDLLETPLAAYSHYYRGV